jgi:adenosylmethionine-8-amino-7-oxononanoate transaminase
MPCTMRLSPLAQVSNQPGSRATGQCEDYNVSGFLAMDNWIQRDLAHLWHPYTQMKDCETLPPVLIDRAQGLKLYDDTGKFYYDTISSWWCNIHGHNHPHIRQAITKQLATLDHVIFAGFTHKPAIELGERLVDITAPNLTRVFYSDNGSTAVEVALKMALQYWRNRGDHAKTRFVCFDRAYHGDTVGAMSVSGDSAFNQVFKPMLFNTFKVPTPYCYRCPMGQEEAHCHMECLDALEDVLKENSDTLAAMIVEPLLLGAAGMVMYTPEYLRRVAELTQKYKVLLILDEVATGFGRTGKMFAYEHARIEPDLLCLSKGLTSGTLPFAATLTTDEVYSAFYGDYSENKTLYHGHTYAANPLGCAAALASLEVFGLENTLEHVQPLIQQFHAGLARFGALDCVGEVRMLGMVGALELVCDKGDKTPFAKEKRIGLRIFQEGLRRQLILRPMGDVFLCARPKPNWTRSWTPAMRSSSSSRGVVFRGRQRDLCGLLLKLGPGFPSSVNPPILSGIFAHKGLDGLRVFAGDPGDWIWLVGPFVRKDDPLDTDLKEKAISLAPTVANGNGDIPC